MTGRPETSGANPGLAPSAGLAPTASAAEDQRSPFLARRSLETLLCWQSAGGAFVAGPTFSQYGYAWLRDGAFIAESLDLAGRLDAAGRFHDWVAGVIAEAAPGMERAAADAAAGRIPEPGDYLHCRYTIDGEPGPDDWPTFQLDGPGIWLWSLAHHVAAGGTLTPARTDAATRVARYLAALRDTPSSDAWEEFPDHVHTSTLGAILAGLQAASKLGIDAPELAGARQAIEARLFAGRGAWTKWAGNGAVDASLLWLVVPYGLVAPGHPVAAATLGRVEAELEDPDGGVHRYPGDTYYGGGAWILLTAALARVRLRRDGPGDRERALAACRWIEDQADAEGNLPEQVETAALRPEHVAAWRERWGPSARPLLWSHAAYLSLRSELARAGA